MYCYMQSVNYSRFLTGNSDDVFTRNSDDVFRHLSMLPGLPRSLGTKWTNSSNGKMKKGSMIFILSFQDCQMATANWRIYSNNALIVQRTGNLLNHAILMLKKNEMYHCWISFIHPYVLDMHWGWQKKTKVKGPIFTLKSQMVCNFSILPRKLATKLSPGLSEGN